MKKRTIILLSVGVAILAVAAVLIYRAQQKPEVYYWRSVPIESGDMQIIVTATGSMAADTSVDVGVQVSGIVAQLKADFNDYVQKGQIIAVLDTTLFYSIQLDAASAVHRAQIALSGARKTYDRSKSLLDQGVIARAEHEVVATSFQTAQSSLTSAKAQLSRAAINLKYCTITAPISGMIIARNVQVGNMVIASFNSPVLFTITNDLKKMQVQVNIDEADIGQLIVGQKAKFTVDAFPNDIFEGVVSQIRRQAVMVQSVVNYVVIITVANPDLKLIPGLTVNANISIEERKNVLKVTTNAFSFTPSATYIAASKVLPDSTKLFWAQKLRQISALQKQEIVETDGASGYLWIIRGKDVYPVLVQKGLNDGSFTEVSGDIHAGDQASSGLNQSAPVETTKSSSPFMPKFPTRKK